MKYCPGLLSGKTNRGFPGGFVVENPPPANAEDAGSVPGGKIPRAAEQLSLYPTATSLCSATEEAIAERSAAKNE